MGIARFGLVTVLVAVGVHEFFHLFLKALIKGLLHFLHICCHPRINHRILNFLPGLFLAGLCYVVIFNLSTSFGLQGFQVFLQTKGQQRVTTNGEPGLLSANGTQDFAILGGYGWKLSIKHHLQTRRAKEVLVFGACHTWGGEP